jgi:hypothetical protein
MVFVIPLMGLESMLSISNIPVMVRHRTLALLSSLLNLVARQGDFRGWVYSVGSGLKIEGRSGW